MTGAKRWLWTLPLLAVLALTALLWRGLYSHDETIPSARLGHRLPAISLARLDAPDQRVDMSLLAAEGPMLINFFASWCAPCQVEHPLLMALAARKVRLIGIAYKDAAQDARRFLARRGNPFSEVLTDEDGRALIEFGASGVPESFLVDASGRIVWHQPGPLTEELIDAELMPRLAALARNGEGANDSH